MVVPNMTVMSDHASNIGAGAATRVSLPLPEGTAEAVRRRVSRAGFSAFVTAAMERELRGRNPDEYLADHERRKGSVPEAEQARARQVLDEPFPSAR